MKYFFALSLLLFTSIQAMGQPSFNCDDATTRIELAICDSNYLSALDVRLNQLYQSARTIEPTVQATQRQWLASRDQSCDQHYFDGRAYHCLAETYGHRLVELSVITEEQANCALLEQPISDTWHNPEDYSDFGLLHSCTSAFYNTESQLALTPDILEDRLKVLFPELRNGLDVWYGDQRHEDGYPVVDKLYFTLARDTIIRTFSRKISAHRAGFLMVAQSMPSLSNGCPYLYILDHTEEDAREDMPLFSGKLPAQEFFELRLDVNIGC